MYSSYILRSDVPHSLVSAQVARSIGYVSVAFGLQRFHLESIYSLVCIIPFVIAFLLPRTEVALRNSLLVLALYLSVDQGAGIYTETPSTIRYFIYFSILATIVWRLRISPTSFGKYLLLIGLWLLITVVNSEFIRYEALYRDFLIVVLIGLVTVSSWRQLGLYQLDFEFLCISLVVALLVELLNALVIFDYSLHGYLSYDSCKFLLVLPAVYFMVEKKPSKAIATLLLTGYILMLYGTRMISVAFVLAALFYLLPRVLTARKSETLVLAALVIGVIGVVVNQLSFEHFKLVGTLIESFSEDSLSNFLMVLDPVRFGELLLFLDRPILEIFLGSGLGTGLQDETGVLSFVSIYQTAFSETEIRSGVFYGFHDVWTDIGFRFGLVFIFVVYLVLISQIISKRSNSALSSIIVFIAITCAFFSTAGLLLCTILALDWRWRQRTRN